MSEGNVERVHRRLLSILSSLDDNSATRHYLAFEVIADICPEMTIVVARDLIDLIDKEWVEACLKDMPF